MLKASVDGHGPIWVKDESAHTSGTFKDRLASGAVEEYPDGALFGSISYGNTAFSFSLACAGLPNHDFIAFVPEGFEDWALGPTTSGTSMDGLQISTTIRALGSLIEPIDLGARYWGDAELKSRVPPAVLDGRSFVNVTEGISVPCYRAVFEESLEQLPTTPDVCVVQYGAGILANECMDFFAEVAPKVQVIPISTPRPDSIARMLYGPIWVDPVALRVRGQALSCHNSPDRTSSVRVPYMVHSTSEEDLRTGIRRARELGLSCEPSGSAGLGFLDHLPELVADYIPGETSVLVVNTGNGIDSIAQRLGS